MALSVEVIQLLPTVVNRAPRVELQANYAEETVEVAIPTKMLAIELVVLEELELAMVVPEPKQVQRTYSCDGFSCLVMLIEAERLVSELMEL